jgi:hypothetical protein
MRSSLDINKLMTRFNITFSLDYIMTENISFLAFGIDFQRNIDFNTYYIIQDKLHYERII